MSIYGFIGLIRTGKTLGMVHQAYIDYKNGAVIYSNIHLSFPHVFVDSVEDIQSIKQDGKKKKLLLDEIWRWIDSRKTKSGKQNDLTAEIMYSGKRGTDIYWTSQRLHQVEKRIRDQTEFIFAPTQVNEITINLAKWKGMLTKAGWEHPDRMIGTNKTADYTKNTIKLPNRLILSKLNAQGKLIEDIIFNDTIFTMTLFDTSEEVEKL